MKQLLLLCLFCAPTHAAVCPMPVILSPSLGLMCQVGDEQCPLTPQLKALIDHANGPEGCAKNVDKASPCLRTIKLSESNQVEFGCGNRDDKEL